MLFIRILCQLAATLEDFLLCYSLGMKIKSHSIGRLKIVSLLIYFRESKIRKVNPLGMCASVFPLHEPVNWKIFSHTRITAR